MCSTKLMSLYQLGFTLFFVRCVTEPSSQHDSELLLAKTELLDSPKQDADLCGAEAAPRFPYQTSCQTQSSQSQQEAVFALTRILESGKLSVNK